MASNLHAKQNVQKRHLNIRSVVVLLLLTLSTVSFFFGISKSQVGTSSGTGNIAVEERYPKENSLDLRQARIGIDLDAKYVLSGLHVDQTVIPDDELQRVPALNQAFFTPTEHPDTLSLSPGRHCAKATFYRFGDSASRANSYSWCFILH